MNWLDIIIAIVLVIFTFIGLKKGLIKAVLSFAGLILGIFLAGRFYISVSGLLTFLPDGVARVIAYILIIIIVLIVFWIIASLLNKLLSFLMLGWLNHLGGAIFGLILGGILCGAILAVWVKYIGGENIISDSLLGAFLVDRFPLILALLPDEFRTIRSFFE